MRSGSTEFIDSNILVYEWDGTDRSKQAAAATLIERRRRALVISSQVACEFAYTASRKLRLTDDEVARILESYRSFAFIPIDIDLVAAAVATARSTQLSFWDALIVESALSAGCGTLWTENLQHGQVIRGVKVKNPFK